MDTDQKIELLKEAYGSSSELDQVLDQLLNQAKGQLTQRLARYEHDLRELERRYEMTTDAFYQRFVAGELGNAMDYFEWASLHELRRDLLTKIHHLQAVQAA